MILQKINIPAKVACRFAPAAPVAIDIDLTEPKTNAMAPRSVPDNSWLESSRDLLHGLQVREMPMDTLPDDLVRAFARTRR